METILNFFRSMCNRCKTGKKNIKPTLSDFLKACEYDDAKKAEKCLSILQIDKNIVEQCLSLSCQKGNVNVVRILLNNCKIETSFLDECLRKACKENRLAISELLVQKGANVLVG